MLHSGIFDNHGLQWSIRWTNLNITGHQVGRTLLSCLKISCLRLKCISLHLKHREAPPEIKKDTWARLLEAYKGNPRHIDPFTGSFEPYPTRQNNVKWDSIRATIILGGLAETTPEDGSVGPLFACIIKKQVLYWVSLKKQVLWVSSKSIIKVSYKARFFVEYHFINWFV